MTTEIHKEDKTAILGDKSLIIVDDDNPFRERLSRAMEKKGFTVSQAESVKTAINLVKIKNQPLLLLILDWATEMD